MKNLLLSLYNFRPDSTSRFKEDAKEDASNLTKAELKNYVKFLANKRKSIQEDIKAIKAKLKDHPDYKLVKRNAENELVRVNEYILRIGKNLSKNKVVTVKKRVKLRQRKTVASDNFQLSSKAAKTLEQIKKVVAQSQVGTVKGTKVDLQTAARILTMYNKITKPENKERFLNLSVSGMVGVIEKLAGK